MTVPETPEATRESPAALAARRAAEYENFKHYAALTFVIGSPLLIALPPRKLDLYTASLASAWLLGANQLTRERTGDGFIGHLAHRLVPTGRSATGGGGSAVGGFHDMPSEKAAELQARMREAREAAINSGTVRGEELERLRRRQEVQRGVLERVWMGSEQEGWKERRLAEEAEALQSGKGYKDLIIDQIWEVWNWGRPTAEDWRDKGNGENEGK